MKTFQFELENNTPLFEGVVRWFVNAPDIETAKLVQANLQYGIDWFDIRDVVNIQELGDAHENSITEIVRIDYLPKDSI